MDERVDEIGEKYNYMFPSIPKRDMNRYLKDILKKLSELDLWDRCLRLQSLQL